MARAARERIHGPYRDDSPASRHRHRWYVVAVAATGRRRVVRFATEAAAEAWRTEAAAESTDRTVSDGIDAYLVDCDARGLADLTIATARTRLRGLLRVDAARDGGPLVRLTPARARTLVEARGGAVVTRRLTLALAGTWARWCVRRGWLRDDPFRELEVVGRPRAGKTQLRVDEARRFAAHCHRAAASGDAAALAVLCALVFGRRASEVTERTARDLDDGGRMLWIPHAKTKAGRVQLEVPTEIRPLLARLARGKAPADRLFGSMTRHHLHHHCERLCREAGVPIVCPQSLRGLHATLARPLVSTPGLVSTALGHAGQAVTERHYYDPGALVRDEQRRALDVLGPIRSSHKRRGRSPSETVQ